MSTEDVDEFNSWRRPGLTRRLTTVAVQDEAIIEERLVLRALTGITVRLKSHLQKGRP
jgi:hypothetical protein